MKYTTPEIEIIQLDTVDVIQTSTGGETPEIPDVPGTGDEGLEIL